MTEGFEHGSDFWRTRVSRRAALRAGVIGGAGLAAAALIGCGDDDEEPAAAPAPTAAPTQAPTAAPAATAAPAGTAAPVLEGTPGGTYRRQISGTPETLDPHRTQSNTTKGASATIHSFLFKQIASTFENAPNSEMAGDLVDSWEFTPDGLTLNLSLRTDAKFTAPIDRTVDSQDVKFSIDRFLGREGHEPAPNAVQLDFIETVGTPDPATAVLGFNRVFSRALWRLADVFNMAVLPTETGVAYDPTQIMVGSGPWMWDELKDGVSHKVQRNPGWHNAPLPYFDGIEDIVLERAQTLTQFQAGNIDFASTIGPDAIPGLLNDFPAGRIEPRKQLGWGYISRGEPRDGSAPWDDPRVRHAMSLALDREPMVEAVYNVSGLEAVGLDVSSLVSWHNIMPAGYAGQSIDPRTDAVTGKWIQYNVPEAKKLMDAAGVGDGFSVPYHYTTRYGTAWTLEAEIIPTFMREIGIDFQTTVDDFASVYTPMTFRGDFDGVAFQLQAFPDHGDYLSEMYRPGAGRNHSKVEDPAIIDAVLDINSTIDIQERNEKLMNIQRDLLIEPMWYVPGVVWQLGWQGFNKRIQTPEAWHGNGRGGEAVFSWPWWWIDDNA